MFDFMIFTRTMLKNLFSKPATTTYPFEPREYPERSRGHIEIDMDKCIFCGMCEDACPKSAIYLTDRLVSVENNRSSFVYGKDKLVEKINERIDITSRQTEKQKNTVK